METTLSFRCIASNYQIVLPLLIAVAYLTLLERKVMINAAT